VRRAVSVALVDFMISWMMSRGFPRSGSGQRIIFILQVGVTNDQEIPMAFVRNPKKPGGGGVPCRFLSKSHRIKTQRIFFPSGYFFGYLVGSNKKAAKFSGQMICLTDINEG
jgi:hypothetical protein